MNGTSENFEFLRWTSTSKCSGQKVYLNTMESLFTIVNSAFSVSSALKLLGKLILNELVSSAHTPRFFVLRSAVSSKLKYIIAAFLLIFCLTSCGKGAASVYLRKGKEYYKKENYQMAIKFFEKTLEVDSNSVEARYYRALCYYGLGHNHHACEEMSVLLKNGYQPADSTLKGMGCFYFPEDTVQSKEKSK